MNIKRFRDCDQRGLRIGKTRPDRVLVNTSIEILDRCHWETGCIRSCAVNPWKEVACWSVAWARDGGCGSWRRCRYSEPRIHPRWLLSHAAGRFPGESRSVSPEKCHSGSRVTSSSPSRSLSHQRNVQHETPICWTASRAAKIFFHSCGFIPPTTAARS